MKKTRALKTNKRYDYTTKVLEIMLYPINMKLKTRYQKYELLLI